MRVIWHQDDGRVIGSMSTPAGTLVARIERKAGWKPFRWKAWHPAWSDDRTAQGRAETLKGAQEAAQAWLSALGVT